MSIHEDAPFSRTKRSKKARGRSLRSSPTGTKLKKGKRKSKKSKTKK